MWLSCVPRRGIVPHAKSTLPARYTSDTQYILVKIRILMSCSVRYRQTNFSNQESFIVMNLFQQLRSWHYYLLFSSFIAPSLQLILSRFHEKSSVRKTREINAWTIETVSFQRIHRQGGYFCRGRNREEVVKYGPQRTG